MWNSLEIHINFLLVRSITVRMNFTWNSNEFHMKYIWSSSEFHVNIAWKTLEIHVQPIHFLILYYTWISYVLHMNTSICTSYEVHMCFIWSSWVIQMYFIWMSCELHMNYMWSLLWNNFIWTSYECPSRAVVDWCWAWRTHLFLSQVWWNLLKATQPFYKI